MIARETKFLLQFPLSMSHADDLQRQMVTRLFSEIVAAFVFFVISPNPGDAIVLTLCFTTDAVA